MPGRGSRIDNYRCMRGIKWEGETGMQEGIRGETVKILGHLRDSMES